MLNVASHETENGGAAQAAKAGAGRLSAVLGALPALAVAPIEELARLRLEERRLEARIRETEEMLSCVRRRTSESLAQGFATGTDNVVLIEEGLMETEQSYERLLQSLLDMKNGFQQQMRSLDEQIVQANVEHLRRTFDQKRNLLDECVAGIDQKILDCLGYIDEYRRAHEDLVALRDKLHHLNSDSLDVPEPVPTHDAQSVISQRIAHLRSLGKF